MQYTKLGNTGLTVSRLCLGAMTFGWSADEKTSFSIMDFALDNGINFIDTANIYSYWYADNKGGESEAIIGRWLKNKTRRDVVIATKVRGPMWQGVNGEGLSRAHILQAVEDSLRRLQTDYIDLYQVHWPDDDTPLEETLSALDSLVRAGKVRYLGASNYPAWLLTKTLWVSDVNKFARFDCLQPHYSLLHRREFERELAALCKDQAVAVIPYSPLAAGFLTGKYSRQQHNPDTSRGDSGLINKLLNDEKAHVVMDEVRQQADRRQVSPVHIALAWLLSKAVITAPIVGARTVRQLQEAIDSVNLRLTPQEIDTLDKLSESF